VSERPKRIQPGRIRRRLTLAFMLVAALTAASVAGSSYLLVREARLGDSVDAGLERARVNLTLAPGLLREGQVRLLAAYERRGGFITVGRTGTRTFSSSLSVGADQVPREVARLVRQGELGYQRTSVAGTRYLVAGGRVTGRKTELYFFFSEEELWEELESLRNILLGSSIALVLLGGLIGTLLAKRTLAPVGRASAAARSLAEGLLETRLPVESADEFGAWAASFNEMADALQAKIDALSEAQTRERRFTSDVAHELRTPLTALVGEAALLRDHVNRMPEEARRPAELLIADVGRLRVLVEDLMEISRLDAGQVNLRRERVDVGSLVAASLRARGWAELVRLADEGLTMTTDPRRLERIVMNLVGNALQHGGRDVAVHVSGDGVGGVVGVSDRGKGIAPENVAHLFDRFYKADPARTDPGSGLGLAIALENARLLGGDLDVRSEPGVGTRFTLRLPVTESLRDGEGAVARDRDDEPASDRGGRS
jgi:signal transduction histidine kinase